MPWYIWHFFESGVKHKNKQTIVFTDVIKLVRSRDKDQRAVALSYLARKPTLWTLRKASTWISLSMPHRLTRLYTFRLQWIFCFKNHYSLPLSPCDGMCRSGSVCAECAGWSGSIHYAESIILLFFSPHGSPVKQTNRYAVALTLYHIYNKSTTADF